MKTIGLQTHIWNNNFKSIVLMALFPLILAFVIFLGILAYNLTVGSSVPSSVQTEAEIYCQDNYYNFDNCVENRIASQLLSVNQITASLATITQIFPFIVLAVLLWFLISFLFHKSMITALTGAKKIDRLQNPDIYNIVENLAISRGIKTPDIYTIEDSSFNAFTSGFGINDAFICFTSGILQKLSKEEIEAVAAHEMTHILNRDIRLMVVAIVFVGIIQTVAQVLVRVRFSSKDNDNKNMGWIFLIQIAIFIIGFFFTIMVQLAISRKREFLADAGAVELTKTSKYMISALQKIDSDSQVDAVKNSNIAQMFIENPFSHKDNKGFLSGLFATHPPIIERIKALEIIG